MEKNFARIPEAQSNITCDVDSIDSFCRKEFKNLSFSKTKFKVCSSLKIKLFKIYIRIYLILLMGILLNLRKFI